ncbi:hypothetical protein KY285_009393 [Solanum tuberosum]|nr:hypothetical protein KY285_009393 [Solanum tuberosum]
MSSSSSFASNSQYCPRWKYDVFLSFRGADTRRTFMGHLYEGLKNRGIFTFQDDKRLEHGDSISEELVKAIEESQVALVVFSKNYATSRWCLNELVKIMDCKTQYGQTVIPVFYDVDPSHVRYQSESFAEAFAKHESRYKDDVGGMHKVKRWRIALSDAADLKGCDIRQGIESENIQQIVNQISSKLCKISLSYLQDIVGIETHMEKVNSLLKMEINDVRIVGIWGMGGVGKTTIVRAIFDMLSPQFDGACFLADIKETKEMHSLQNILLSELLRKKEEYVNNKVDGKHLMARRLRFKKVLVVLDDINHGDHLDNLAGDLDWFGKGSRIIATTRDKHLIGKNDVVYEVTTLVDHQAIQLFNQLAFKDEVPDKSFEKLTLEVVGHANGLPLALKVWGSFLHNRDITAWRSAIEQMKMNSKSEIVEKLKISYDGLETIQRDVFLHIACFLRGQTKEYIMQILESCYAGAGIELSVLIDKSLVLISDDDTIQMHDLIQDMGKYIVKLQKDDPSEYSRLWDPNDFEEVMVNNTGTKATEAIWLQGIQHLCFSKKAMKNMKRLKILRIGNFRTNDDSIEYLPNSLHWFECDGYPWESLPKTFEPKRLVHLKLSWSWLSHLWTEIKHLPSLQTLDLSYSYNLMRTPDFTGMPNLEYLDLMECRSLEEVHRSLEYCRKLIRLNLIECVSLVKFPCVNVESLESLDLDGCSGLEKFPEIVGRMKPELDKHQTHSTVLYLTGLKSLVALPSSICKFKGLVKLNVWGCSELESLPEEIGDLENLEELDASYTLISRPPSSIVRLNKLKSLTFEKDKSEYRVNFMFPLVSEGLRSLEILDLSYCNLIDGGLPEDIECLHSLKELNLSGNNFEHLPGNIAQFVSLKTLDLSHCDRLTQLPEFPQQLNTINADWSNDSFCDSLFQNISSLQHAICASDSLSLRVFMSWAKNIPGWFLHQAMGASVSVALPENWYVSDNFLGFAVCYLGKLIDITAHLIPLCDDGMPSMTQEFSLSNHSDYADECGIGFLLVHLCGLWDASKANGKTPNDYGCIMLYSPQKRNDFGEINDFGVRLLYKDDAELCIGIRRSRYEEASFSSSKKQRPFLQLFPTSPGL